MTFFELIKHQFFAPLRLCVRLIHTVIQQRPILVEQTEFRLPPDQWEAFCQRLDAPPKVIPGLRQLFSEPEPF